MASPNAKTREETVANGPDTFGVLNQHPTAAQSVGSAFKVGVSVDRNKKCRRTMEDAHSFIYDFGGIRGQGYFAVFDGHAGKHAAEWCGEHFHEHLLEALRTSPTTPIPDLLNHTFHKVDTKLSLLAATEKTHSGCTAVTAFLRLEDEHGNAVGSAGGVGDAVEVKQGVVESDPGAALFVAREVEEGLMLGSGVGTPTSVAVTEVSASEDDLAATPAAELEEKRKARIGSGEGILRGKLKDLLTPSSKSSSSSTSPPTSPIKTTSPESIATTELTNPQITHSPMPIDPTKKPIDMERLNALPRVPTPHVEVKGPAAVLKAAKRTLYTANVGDARAVLSRGGKAVRLTYDHKGTDAKEAKRITDAGGFVMNNRVAGVLAVTRSLGDSSMKEFVVGSPYTTETTLGAEDEFLIVACDGLWDVCDDQKAVDIIKGIKDPQEASRALLDFALHKFSSDNLSVLVIALQPQN